MRSLDYLRKLPTVFSNKDAMRLFGKNDAWVKLAAHRWKEQGLIRPGGPRLGIYYNLLADPDWRSHLPEIVRRVFPSAVVIGASVLHAHGWITQIPQYLYVVVPDRPTRPKIGEVLSFPRSVEWYREMSPWDNLSVEGLCSLSPQKALDDCRAHRTEIWCPDEDDLYIDEDREQSRPSD